jgi:hypothetical protein
VQDAATSAKDDLTTIASKGGKRSGEVRKALANERWRDKALEQAKLERQSDPSISQLKLAENIKGTSNNRRR